MAAARERESGVLSRGVLLLLFTAFLGASLVVYRPALDGPPIADDFAYLVNPWLTSPDPRLLVEVLDPTSQATRTLRNFAPVRGLLHALEWRLFPENAVAYHTTNLLAHALATTLLVAFFARLGVRPVAAALAGWLFLLHPANVEAVAWMSQLWSPVALAFSILALLALPRRPGLASLAFVLALGSKPLALFALPTAIVLERCRTRERGAGSSEPPAHWGWIAAWAVLCAAQAVAQLSAAAGSGHEGPLHPDLGVELRAMATFAFRYLVMGATSFGVSAFQEPPLPLSPWDPWWLASAGVLALLGWRLLVTWRKRSPEAAGWLWALAAFAPVSQVFPFLYPMADRYLYFMLPGLLLAGALALQDGLARLSDTRWRRGLWRAAGAAALALALVFAARSASRAALWRSEDALLRDAAAHFPDGVSSCLLRSRRAAQAGDVEGAIAPLREAAARGWDWYDFLLTHPAYVRVREDPRFRAWLRELAAQRIAKGRRGLRMTQLDWLQDADAHLLRGETREAAESLERGLALGGPLDAQLRARRAQLATAPAAGSG